jgi:hypothetical protein
VEAIEKNKNGWSWGLTFLHNTKFSSFGGTKKLYWRRIFGGLYEFFKFNLYCYHHHKCKVEYYIELEMMKVVLIRVIIKK